MDKMDENVQNFMRLIETRSKNDFGLYARKIEMPFPENPNPVKLEKAPPPYDSKDVAPFSSQFDHFDFDKDSVIIVASKSNTENWASYTKVFTKMKIRNAILVYPEELGMNQIENIRRTFDKLAKNALFYWTYIDSNDPETQVWNQVITLNHFTTAVLNPMNVSKTGHFIEYFNLHGLHLFGININFPPFGKGNDACRKCKKLTKCGGCTKEGVAIDTVDNAGKMMNFTWESHVEPNNKVGSAPAYGPANASGAWEGTLGALFYGDYQLSANAWNNKLGRSDMFDFSSFVSDRAILALTPQPASLDLWLFKRPFRNEAWLVLGIVILVILLTVIALNASIKDASNYAGYRIVVSIGWLFVLLISVYYDGALTMFFSTEVSITFDSIRDVMRAYDDWKLMMQDVNDVYFVYFVEDGDPDYTAFWDRKLNKPEETVFKSAEEGVTRMRQERVVLHLQEGTLKGYLKENPELSDNIKVFAPSSPEYFNIIVNNNSPLGPVFQQASLLLVEQGVRDHIAATWLGRDIGSSSTTNLDNTLMVLGPAQIVLVFFVLLFAVIISLVVFICEKLFAMNFGEKPLESK